MQNNVTALLGLEKQLREASSLAQLFYTVVNQFQHCIPYHQAVLLLPRSSDEDTEVVAISDIPSFDYTSPYVQWVERLHKEWKVSDTTRYNIESVDAGAFSGQVKTDWQEMAPSCAIRIPLITKADNNVYQGTLLLFRDEPLSDKERALCLHLRESIAYSLFALRPNFKVNRVLSWLKTRKVMAGVSILLAILLCLPIRLSTLAPVSVIPFEPYVITAPIDGVIGEIAIEPNQTVGKGTILGQYDVTTLESDYDVAQRELNVARVELQTIEQSGFLNPDEKAQLASKDANVQLKEVEAAYAQKRLEQATLTSPVDGVAVINDPNQWKGQPVHVGERILLIANPEQIQFEILLPVKDSIAITPDAEVKVFLDNDPLNPFSAQIRHASYHPQATDDGNFAYRLLTHPAFDEPDTDEALPRLGMKGVARIYGERVTLFFYLFRRPVTSVRQWLGW